jgi:hypothetical protein
MFYPCDVCDRTGTRIIEEEEKKEIIITTKSISQSINRCHNCHKRHKTTLPDFVTKVKSGR